MSTSDGRAGQRHVLAVALHLDLLQVRRQTPQPVVVSENALRGAAQHVDVPHAHQPEQHRQVLPQRRVAEMAVHRPGAIEHRLELLPADGQRDHQPDRRPQRIAAAHPVAEAEGVVWRDAEFGHRLQVGGERGEVLADRGIAQRAGDPVARRVGVGHGLQRGEGLGGDQEQGARRIECPGSPPGTRGRPRWTGTARPCVRRCGRW